MSRILPIIILTLAGTAHAQNFEQVKAQSAKAIGVQSAKGEWTLVGTELNHGSSHPYRLSFDTAFRYRSASTGLMAESQGFDGTSTWQLNWSGIPNVVGYSDRDLARIDTYVRTGLWAAKDSPIEIVSADKDTYTIKCRDGKLTATLTIDSASHLPKTLAYWVPTGTETWTYSNYKKLNGIQIATKALRQSEGTHDEITIESSSHSARPKASYEKPPIDQSGFVFDASKGSEIEVKHLFGYLFVKPLLNGNDDGWFFLDTGAEVMVLDPAIAKKYGAKSVGKENVSGVVGSVTTDFVQGIEFQLGPATLKNPTFMQLDMTDFSKALGIKLAGICGYDMIGRVSLDIDPSRNVIGIYQPGKAPLPDGAAWTKFVFHGSVPSLICKFEGDHDGLFSLDTGSGSTVDFFSPTVKKFELLKNRKLTDSRTGGAGGSTVSKSGTVEWFQIGSKRFDKPRATFQITDKGAFASPFADGNIGMGFLGKFRMILDYQSSQIAFVAKS